ncbi:hypothetical protein M3J09_006902 [Ascochyta lentis]
MMARHCTRRLATHDPSSPKTDVRAYPCF